jgi:hypothetical protein
MSDRLVKRLAELTGLADGWHNGEGIAPTSEAVEVTAPLAKAFMDDVSLFPTLTGGLQFEGDNFHLVISNCGISHYSLDED